MKKWLVWLTAAALALVCAACGPAPEDDIAEAAEEMTAAAEDGELYVALVTGVGNIDDQSLNQACWEAVSQFAEENGLEYAYYRSANQSDDALAAAIAAAAAEGVGAMVCPGSLFEAVLPELAEQYPEISFLLVDGELARPDEAGAAPADASAEASSEAPAEAAAEAAAEALANVHCIVYREEQAGYLAGYAAVSEGYTKLGFLGGMELPAVKRFGYGFIQGADQAAKQTNVQVEINYWYSGAFDPGDPIYRVCAEWYNNGSQVIFACGGKLFKSVIQAAEEGEGRQVIGADADQAPLSETILTSAMKELRSTTYEALCALMDDGWTWPEDLAGCTVRLGAAENAVGLPTAESSWRFEKFTKESYQQLLAGVIDGSVEISDAIARQPETTNTTVNFIK